MATYSDNGITFPYVSTSGLEVESTPVRLQGGYTLNGNTITNKAGTTVNAIDIDWNGAQVGEGDEIELETTGELLKWIKDSNEAKADKVEGKGLSTNDYTTTEKNKLEGIESGAQVNVKPDWNAVAGADAEILNKPTIPAAQIQSDWNQTDTTALDYIKNKPNLSGLTHFDIQVVQNLPDTDISESTIYLLPGESTGTNNLYTEYIYINNNWEKLGEQQNVDIVGQRGNALFDQIIPLPEDTTNYPYTILSGEDCIEDAEVDDIVISTSFVFRCTNINQSAGTQTWEFIGGVVTPNTSFLSTTGGTLTGELKFAGSGNHSDAGIRYNSSGNLGISADNLILLNGDVEITENHNLYTPSLQASSIRIQQQDSDGSFSTTGDNVIYFGDSSNVYIREEGDNDSDNMLLSAENNITLTSQSSGNINLNTGGDISLNADSDINLNTDGAVNVNGTEIGSAIYKNATTSVTQNSDALVTSGAVYSALQNVSGGSTYKLTVNGTTNGDTNGTSLGSVYAPTSAASGSNYVITSDVNGKAQWTSKSNFLSGFATTSQLANYVQTSTLSNYVQSVSVNNGTPVTPDSSGNVNLTVSTGSNSSQKLYNGVFYYSNTGVLTTNQYDFTAAQLLGVAVIMDGFKFIISKTSLNTGTLKYGKFLTSENANLLVPSFTDGYSNTLQHIQLSTGDIWSTVAADQASVQLSTGENTTQSFKLQGYVPSSQELKLIMSNWGSIKSKLAYCGDVVQIVTKTDASNILSSTKSYNYQNNIYYSGYSSLEGSYNNIYTGVDTSSYFICYRIPNL